MQLIERTKVEQFTVDVVSRRVTNAAELHLACVSTLMGALPYVNDKGGNVPGNGKMVNRFIELLTQSGVRKGRSVDAEVAAFHAYAKALSPFVYKEGDGFRFDEAKEKRLAAANSAWQTTLLTTNFLDYKPAKAGAGKKVKTFDESFAALVKKFTKEAKAATEAGTGVDYEVKLAALVELAADWAIKLDD